jgi:tellurium resistance protein TerD
MPVPVLMHTIAKGQKISLAPQAGAPEIKCLLGWNVTRADVDIDISAFMLGANGKVPGEDWFVFYSQTDSPDRSVRYEVLNNGTDRQSVSVNLSAVDPSISKIVFVLTINEALEKNLNFSMVKDAYIRIMNSTDNQELASYKMTDYYSNVISMMIGEVYRHGTEWKFNAVGNGVAKDLAGLCELYGVETV